MWAATQFFDLLCFPEWVGEPSGVALFLLAVAVLGRPSASGRVLLMCAANLVYLYVRSPITPNHIFFQGFVNLAILGVAFRHRRLPEPAARAAVFAEAAPVLRGLLLALYGFAFLHKLNWDFLAPATSCAGFMMDGIAGRFGFGAPGGPIRTVVVWLTLAVEGGIPLLLLAPSTRRLALLLAWPFHVGLSFHPRPGIYGFSAMLFALLALYLPAGIHVAIAEHPLVRRVAQAITSIGASWPRPLVGGVFVGVLAAGGVALAGIEPGGTSLAVWIRRGGMLLWLPYAAMLLAALIMTWPAALGGARASSLLRLRTPAVAVLLLFLLNGLAPYLGFQTLRTLSMFSNIRTEGDRTNHLFIPAGLQVADYQDDLVRLIDSSDIWLDFYARNKSLLPFTELRRRVWEQPGVPVRVTYERAGRIEALDTSKPGAERQAPPVPFPLRKILAFREVDPDGQPLRCLW